MSKFKIEHFLNLTKLLVIALACSACEQLATPTAPSVSSSPAFMASGAVIALELLPGAGPDFTSGTGLIGVRARNADGDIVAADVACTSTTGTLLPARFSTRTQPGTELAGARTLATVRCSSGAIAAETSIDLSAWHVDFATNDYSTQPEGTGGMNRVLLASRQRIAGVPLTRVSLDWGDGAIEVSRTIPLMATPTMYHRYAAPGIYVATARVEWPGGAFERRQTIRSERP